MAKKEKKEKRTPTQKRGDRWNKRNEKRNERMDKRQEKNPDKEIIKKPPTMPWD